MNVISAQMAKVMDAARTATYHYNNGDEVNMTKRIDGELVNYTIGFNTTEEAQNWFNKHILGNK